MRGAIKISIFFLGLTVSCAQAASDVKTLLIRLETKMSEVKSIETDFTQEKRMTVFNQPIISKGKIFIQKPSLFSWRVNSPVHYTMFINGDIIRQWDEESNQIQQFSFSRNPGFSIAIAQMQVWFSGAYVYLLKDYDVNIISEEPVILEFAPIQSNPAFSLIKSVKVFFEKDGRYLQEIRIEEKNQDATILTFSSVKLNMPIDPSVWELKSDVQ